MDEIRAISKMQPGDVTWTGVLNDPAAQAAIWCNSKMSDVYLYSAMTSSTMCVSRMK